MAITSPNYTQIPNEILDVWMDKLSGTEFKIIMAICRKTFGWQKKEDSISVSQFMSITGAGRRQVFDSIKRLEEEGLIICVRVDGFPTKFSINVAEAWGCGKGHGGGAEKDMGGVSENAPTKETTKKTNKEIAGGDVSKPTDSIPPDESVVADYLREINETRFTAKEFVDYYDARGWMLGKVKMKRWRSAVGTWRSNADKRNGKSSSHTVSDRPTTLEEIRKAYGMEARK